MATKQPKNNSGVQRVGRGGRGNARRDHRGRTGNSDRNSNWIRQKDIPKGNDDRWDTNWDCPDIYEPATWATDEGSRRADGGLGDQLYGWDGKLAPAPLNWDSRPAFRNLQSADAIDQWMLDMDKVLDTTVPEVEVEISNKDGQTTGQEIASRHWIPVALGQQSLQTFWNELLHCLPLPVDDDDLEGVVPWWERYESMGSSLLEACPSPFVPQVSPDETRDQRLARENDNGSNTHAQNRVQFERAKRDAAEASRQKIRTKERRINKITARTRDEDSHQTRLVPRIKVYLRPGKPDDMHAICKIFNYYVEQTGLTLATERVEVAQMTEHFQKIQSLRLPFVVACERGEIIRAGKGQRGRREEEDIFLPDCVIGFAFADSYSDTFDAYRYSVKIELYMAYTHYMKGVGKCLMDKLMACLDPQHIERGGYVVEDEKLECANPERVVQNIFFSMPFDDSNTPRMHWMTRWLTEKFGFDDVGDLVGVGYKLDRK